MKQNKPWEPFEHRATAFLEQHELKITVRLAKQFYDEEDRMARDGDTIASAFTEHMQVTGAQKVLEDVRGRIKYYWVKITPGIHVKRRGVRAVRKYDADGGAYYQPSMLVEMQLQDFRALVAEAVRQLQHDTAYCKVLIRARDATAAGSPTMTLKDALAAKGLTFEALLEGEA
jgi:hypothetical protein